MPTTSLIDPTLEGVARALTVHARRHAVLAANVANVETPGYRAQDTDFQHALRDAFSTAESGDPAPRAERVVEDRSVPPRADGNTVDLDLAMAELSDNAQRYQALTKILTKRLGLLRQAIDGSR
jgi:flagellar basal-body rod protein FlgB